MICRITNWLTIGDIEFALDHDSQDHLETLLTLPGAKRLDRDPFWVATLL